MKSKGENNLKTKFKLLLRQHVGQLRTSTEENATLLKLFTCSSFHAAVCRCCDGKVSTGTSPVWTASWTNTLWPLPSRNNPPGPNVSATSSEGGASSRKNSSLLWFLIKNLNIDTFGVISQQVTATGSGERLCCKRVKGCEFIAVAASAPCISAPLTRSELELLASH